MLGKRPGFAAAVTAATLVPLAVFGGVAFAKGLPSASEYQYGPSGGQYGKMTICHHTHSKKNPQVTITISANAWPAHQKHGDTQGACDQSHSTKPGNKNPGNDGTHGNSGNSGSSHDAGSNGDHGNSGTHGNSGNHGKP
jgi:hypothetical protein